MLRLIRTDELKGKTVRQLIFEICPLREEQAKRFERINFQLKKQQKKIDFEKVRKKIMGLSNEEFEKEKERIKKPWLRNRTGLFKVVREGLERGQGRKREIKFREIREKLEERGSYRRLEFEISRRREKLKEKSECIFPVLCGYIEEYKKAKE